MLIAPKINRSKLIIIASLLTLVLVTVFMMFNRLELSDENSMLHQEKTLMLNELSEMIDVYETVELLNDTLKLQLKQSKDKLINIRDSINNLNSDDILFDKLKPKVAIFRSNNNKILSQLGIKELEIKKLLKEKKEFKKILNSRDSLTKLLSSKYEIFQNNNKVSKNNTSPLDIPLISNLNVKGTKRITSKGRVVDTKYARRTKKFHVEFTLVKNKFLSKGTKTLYFQVLRSNMTVVASKGTVSFGEKSLIYSKKKNFNYNGKESVVSVIIDKNEKEKLEKGTYYINVIYQGEVLAKQSIVLK